MRILLSITFLLFFSIKLIGQKNKILTFDSIQIDSIAKILLVNDTLDWSYMHGKDIDRVLKQKFYLKNKEVIDGAANFPKKLIFSMNEKAKYRDSIISLPKEPLEWSTVLALAKLLIECDDSVSMQYLFSHPTIVFDNSQYEDWSMFPLFQLLVHKSKGRLDYFPIIMHECESKILDYLIVGFYSDTLKNIFIDQEEIMYILLHKQMSQNSNNEILKKNILKIKSYLKN
jgi:hypothetical protein